MGLTDQYIKMLGLNDEEIDKMPGEQAKEILKIVNSLSSEELKEGSEIDLNRISTFTARKD